MKGGGCLLKTRKDSLLSFLLRLILKLYKEAVPLCNQEPLKEREIDFSYVRFLSLRKYKIFYQFFGKNLQG
ncbi:MAG: hypothetical protein D6785_02740, partial [Planctomycetota bacterium]